MPHEFAHETAREAVLSVALSVVRGVPPELLLHALSLDLALLFVHGVGRELGKALGPLSLVLPEVQTVWWAEGVSLWLQVPLESSSLGAIFDSISYFTHHRE